ncbi:MAG: Lrp/AsnC family transcriptional regulator [Flavobacteriaceae bacterium]|nr:Lrp/AsnC family transcriptional regulator [Flavobacteriaceae bacterium]MCY4268315.1 Lrp/AsnC family transcriptional regulator [Flavobacteriaceae bacterium]MCY4297816.1 Lrp/AsnC family transcriptional regulator [Flavobacteriaceae bacterium]
MKTEKIDHIDHKILEFLVQNTRVPFTKISEELKVSTGTVHVRVKKLMDSGVILGTNLNLDYVKLGFPVVAFVGIHLDRTNRNSTEIVMEKLKKIPFITVIQVTLGPYNVFCKVRAKDTFHIKEIIYSIDDINGVLRTESFISMGEVVNDKRRLLDYMFQSLK